MALGLELSGLTKHYKGLIPDDDVFVFDNISFNAQRGEFLSIVGPSGCGKTTLLRIIAGLEQAFKGNVLLEGKPIKGRDARIGMVFQEFALFPWRKMVRNIEMGLEIRGISKEERRSEAKKYIHAFGLKGFEERYPKELSGGMKQRVAIARTLISNPEIVLMDEPFGSLDSQTRNNMQEFLLKIRQQRQDTIVFVTHNVDEAVYLSDRIIVLSHRPARILKTFEVMLKRPRNRTGGAVNQIRREILELLSKV